MAPKNNGKKMVKSIEIISIITVAIFLIIYLLTIISASPSFYTEMGARVAADNFDEDMKQVTAPIKDHYEQINQVAEQLAYADSSEAVANVLKSYYGNDSEVLGDFSYVYRNVAYTYNGYEIEAVGNMNEQVMELAKGNAAGNTAVYNDENYRCECIAFFVPVRGSLYIDGLLSIVPRVDLISVGDTIRDKTTAIAVVEPEGYVLSSLTAEGFEQKVGAHFVDYIQLLTQNQESVDTVKRMLSGQERMISEFLVGTDNYTMVVEPMEILDGHAYLVTLSESKALVPTEFDYVSHVGVVIVIATIALVASACLAIFFNKKVDAAVASVNLTDSTLGCHNVEGFKKNISEILERKSQGYAVVVYSIKRFHFIEDRFGSHASLELLRYIKEVLTSVCGEGEVLGYAGDGKFLLLEDFRSESVFRNRLLVFEGIVNKYDLLKENQVKVQVAAGVYLVNEDKRRPVADMIDCATIVCDEARTDSGTPYAIYTETVREKINRDEHLEARMEAALSSNEFRLFLQPKYNVEKDAVDSAEALVRWFDYQKGDYRYPAEFISLFESNGFIVEMDHFIYLEVLKYLSEAKSRGDKVVPISVNVSRVTAASPDFVNFYVGSKRRYLIDDNLLTLEFTESYATEDYERLSRIVDELHEGGIRCSIDDFGEGYSSFRIMKDLRMDELKLDRLFLAKGVDPVRDDMIITTITELARSCGMTVVMEGVETKAMYDRVVRMGIGTIQGYYYAKAIPLEEFKIFVNSNTSIRYKAVVK